MLSPFGNAGASSAREKGVSNALYEGGIFVRWLKTYADRCIGCGKCAEVCSTTYFKENNGACSRIQVTDPGAVRTLSVCNQCGTCIAVCPTQAISRDKNGVVQIDKKKCTSCLMCVGFCPTGNMMAYAPKQSEPFKCIACGLCARSCPAQALELKND